MPKEPIEDLAAGDNFRDTLVPLADFQSASGPAWFGWAIMDAFLAGAAYGRANPKPKE